MNAKRGTLVIFGVVAAVTAALVFLPRGSSPKGTALAGRERALELLGAEIAKVRPGCKVLVLSNPLTKGTYFDERTQYERAGIRGLRKGLGRRSSVEVVFPEILPEYFTQPQSISYPADCRTPLSFLILPASLEQLAAAHPDYPVIVSLIGLPAGVDQLKIWNEKGAPSFALLSPDLRLLGSPTEAAGAFQRGKVLAAVFEDPDRGEPLVVTRENIGNLLEKQPKALGY